VQNLVDTGRRKWVCVGWEFSVTFCPLFYFVLLLTPTGHSRRPITTVYGLKRVFPRKVGPFGVSIIKNNVWGSKLMKDISFESLNELCEPDFKKILNTVNAQVLNKNKIQDYSGRHLRFLHKQQ